MGMYFIIAARNLIQARRRSLLLGTLFGLVTALLVVLLSLSNGISDTMIRSATTLTTGHVNVAGFYKANAGDSSPLVTNAPEIRKIVEENTEGVAYIIDRGRGWCRVVSETGAQFAGITGIDPKQETRLAKTLVPAAMNSYVKVPDAADGGTGAQPEIARAGVHPDLTKPDPKTDLSQLGQPGTIVLFATQAKKLEVGVGDELTLTALTLRGSSNSALVRVVAVCEDVGLLSMITMFTSKQTGLDLYQLRPDTTGAIQIYLKDIDKSDEVMDHLRKVFAEKKYAVMEHDPNPFYMKFEGVQGADWLGQELDVTTWHDEVSFLAKVLTGITYFMVTLLVILVFIIGVGIMNAMWMSVRERTGEIGTLRAIGMQRSSVLWMFLLEALLLGLAATTTGGIFGGVGSMAIDSMQYHIPVDALRLILLSDKLHLVVHPLEVIESIVAFTLVAGLAAVWPATRGASLQPVTAIQQVD